VRRLVGRSTRAATMAACTSRAAPSMLRPSANCSVMRVEPVVLCEVISETSAMTPRWRSSGVATVVAIVSGLAPGIWANTEIVGKSTCGSGATGSLKNANIPASASPIVSRVVATGRSMNGVDRFTAYSRQGPSRRALGVEHASEALPHRPAEAVEIEVDDRRREQRQQLAQNETADDRDAKRMAQFRSGAGPEHQRQGAEHRRHRRHHDRAETQQRCLIDRLARRLALVALRVEGKIDDHDAVLLDDADQQDDADDRDDAEIAAIDHQRQ